MTAGPFISCNNYPEYRYTRQISNDNDADSQADTLDEDRLLGTDLTSDLPGLLRKGPYGHMCSWVMRRPKAKTILLPQIRQLDEIDLTYALGLLSLPRAVGAHPQTGDLIEAGLGRYGPYLKYQGRFTSLTEDDVLEVGINRAVDLLAEAQKKAGRTLGAHPEGGQVELKKGRFGPYVEHNKLRAPVPRGTEMADITLEDALVWLAAKAARPAKKPAKKAAKKGAKKTSGKAANK